MSQKIGVSSFFRLPLPPKIGVSSFFQLIRIEEHGATVVAPVEGVINESVRDRPGSSWHATKLTQLAEVLKENELTPISLWIRLIDNGFGAGKDGESLVTSIQFKEIEQVVG